MTQTLAAPSGRAAAAQPSVGAPDGTGWRLADPPMLRVNAVTARRMGDDRLRHALAALYAAERERSARADAACDELYELAGVATGAGRSRLLGLKRAVHNGRSPGATDWLRPAPPSVAAWLAATERADLARTAIESGHAGFLAEERGRLAHALDDHDLRLALALISPEVYEAAQRYRRSRGAVSARDKKSERGLVQHLARAMMRVSPLSRYTAVGFGRWTDGAPGLDAVRVDRRSARAVLSVDQSMLLELVGGLVPEAPARTGPATVRVNPRLRVEGELVRFVQVVDGVRRTVATPCESPVAALLQLLATGPLPTGALVRALAATVPLPAPDARALVRAAVTAQLLVAGPPFDQQTPDGLAAAVARLADVDVGAARAVSAVRDALTAAADGSTTQRVAALTRVRDAAAVLNERSRHPVELRVNEDYLLPETPVSTAGYAAALRDLAGVAGMASLFDRHHEMRGLLLRAFTDAFGAGASVPLLPHADALVRQVRSRARRLGPDSAGVLGPRDGSLRELLDRRAAAAAELGARIGAATDEGAEELHLDPSWLASWSGLVPAPLAGSAASYALLVQPSAGRLVVNGCYPGHGQLLTRFLGRCGGPADRVAERIERLYGGDAVPVEDRGLHGNNLNHRPAVLDEALTPEGWLAVVLRHDPARDRLELVDGGGRVVRVLSLGMKWIEAQPAPLLLAAWLAGPSMVAFDPLHRAYTARSRPDAATVALPRLVAGDVVVQRRRWYPGADLAEAIRDRAAEALLLSLTRWRAAHGIPEQVFVKTPLWRLAGQDATSEAIRQYVADRRRDKPQYVDLASALMVRVLPRLMERRRAGFVEEALPVPRPGTPAREWAVELDRQP